MTPPPCLAQQETREPPPSPLESHEKGQEKPAQAGEAYGVECRGRERPIPPGIVREMSG